MVVSHKGVWVVSWFFGQVGGREGEIDAAKEGKINLLPLPLRVNGKGRYSVSLKMTPFWAFLYIYEQRMK
jgi:hypothetical protein